MHAPFGRLSGAKKSQHQSSTFAHDVHEGASQCEEDVHGSCYCEGHALSAMQRKGLGDNLAQDDVHVGNKRKSYGGCNTMSVNCGMWYAAEERLDQSLNRGLSQP